MMAQTCHPSTLKTEEEKSHIEGSPGDIVESCLENTRSNAMAAQEQGDRDGSTSKVFIYLKSIQA